MGGAIMSARDKPTHHRLDALLHDILPLFLALAVIVALAKTAGYASVRLGQPAVLGELLIGLVLGPTLLDMLHWPAFHGAELGPTITALANLGVLVLMFVAGLEVDPQALRRAGRSATITGIAGVAVPMLVAALAFPLMGYSMQQSLFLGLVLAATSVSISAQTLMELGVLRSAVGVALLGAAIIDDVLVVLLLAMVLALGGGGGGGLAVVWVFLRMALFLAAVLVIGRPLVRWLATRVDDLPVSEGVMSLAVVAAFGIAWASEALGGMAAITGAFMAGLLFRGTNYREHIENGMHTLAYALLVPVFFVNIGLEADARAIGMAGLPFALLFVLIAALTKVVGCGLGARAAGLSSLDSLRLGVGMTSRGEVGLIVAAIGIESGVLSRDLFATTVVMVLATTLLTPMVLRTLYPRGPAASPADPSPTRIEPTATAVAIEED